LINTGIYVLDNSLQMNIEWTNTLPLDLSLKGFIDNHNPNSHSQDSSGKLLS